LARREAGYGLDKIASFDSFDIEYRIMDCGHDGTVFGIKEIEAFA
jgi:hypothetical protein